LGNEKKTGMTTMERLTTKTFKVFVNEIDIKKGTSLMNTWPQVQTSKKWSLNGIMKN